MTRSLRLLAVLAVPVAGLVLAAAAPHRAEAHFALVDPPAYSVQSSVGSPQKSAPCGQADPGNPPVPTNVVTTFQQGSTITVTISEKVYHPGWYRVALATDQGSLPADPLVTPGANTPCGAADIMSPPVFPVLADNMLAHNSAFSGPQSFQVTLPAGMTCTNCTLQVIEFMSNHALNNPGGCFYHHCAQVDLTTDAPPDASPFQPDADPATAPDAGGNPGDDTGAGGGCCNTGSPGTSWVGSLVVGFLLLRRRRRPTAA